MTKRRIRWRYGTANTNALEAGKVGVECRGHEHEVTLVWSITSGKRLIVDDGKEVHFTVGRRAEGKFQHSWTSSNNHVLTIVAHASPPLKQKAGFKQFDLLIDGISFSAFPCIYQLEKRATSSRSSATLTSVRRSEYRSDRETLRSNREEMQWANVPNTFENDRSARNITAPQPKKQTQPEYSLPSPTVSLLDMENLSSPSVDSATFWDSGDSFPSFDSSPNQPPTYEAVRSSIMGAYDTNYSETIPTQTTYISMPDMTKLHIDTDFPDELLKNNETSTESPKEVSDFDGALQNLVNLDDISSSVLKGYTRQNCEMNKKQNSTRSLSELKSMQNGSSSCPTKEIMKSHQSYYTNNPGAVVVYGQTEQRYNTYACNVPPYNGAAY